jgi:hypothetical protein
MSKLNLDGLLADEIAKQAAMTVEERREYIRRIIDAQIQIHMDTPYTEGERQARAMRPKPTLADALELREVRALIEALKDAASGLEYVRYHYGELHGVGFDRVRDASDAALAALQKKGVA